MRVGVGTCVSLGVWVWVCMCMHVGGCAMAVCMRVWTHILTFGWVYVRVVVSICVRLHVGARLVMCVHVYVRVCAACLDMCGCVFVRVGVHVWMEWVLDSAKDDFATHSYTTTHP